MSDPIKLPCSKCRKHVIPNCYYNSKDDAIIGYRTGNNIFPVVWYEYIYDTDKIVPINEVRLNGICIMCDREICNGYCRENDNRLYGLHGIYELVVCSEKCLKGKQ